MAKIDKIPGKNQPNSDKTDYYTPSPERPFYIDMIVDGKLRRIWVTKEHFHAYWRDFNLDRDRIDRESRCQIGDGKGGLKRCDLKCEECPFSNQGHREGTPISPEFLMEEYELEIAGMDDPATEYEALERREAVDRAVSLLPDADRAIVHMRYWEEKTTEQIARAMGMSQTGAAKRLRKIEGLLREKLSALMNG